MGYEHKTIKDIIRKIVSNEMYLPAIQRKLVWNHEQIEKLFDSIMLGYPIGTFLFWNVNVDEETFKNYTFYKFIHEFNEKKSLNELAPNPELRKSIIGVLDGQQRLTSMYIALQGSYAFKTPGAHKNKSESSPKRLFYFNLLKDISKKNENSDEDDIMYEFKFLTEDESKKNDESHFWFPVKQAMKWNEANEYINYAANEKMLDNKIFINNLTALWQRINKDEIINYFEVSDQNLDNILKIFIRVNSGGTVLSKSDLLFSTIVANWKEAREKIEILINNINDKGDKFNFDNDFIMRSCLFLTELPVLFKVDNFRKDNIQKIKENWNLIEDSLNKTVDLLVEFGFNGENLTSNNSIIPISYHIYKNGNLIDDDKNKIRGYLISSLLKLIYGGKNDMVLQSIRDSLKNEYDENGNKSFALEKLNSSKLPDNKTFIFNEEDVDNLFNNKKGPYTFMVLSLLYPHLKLSQIKFHQDHLHPESSFKYKSLKSLNIPDGKKWKDDKDKLANLQLLMSNENISKSDKPLIDFLKSMPQNQLSDYKKTNFIPEPDNNENFEDFYSFANFENFLEKRKELMKQKIIEILSGLNIYKSYQ